MGGENCASYYLILILFLASTTWSTAYDIEIPEGVKERHAQIDEYLAVAEKTLKTNINESIEAARKARKLSSGFDNRKLITSSLSLADAYRLKGVLDSSLLLVNLALKDAKTLKNDTLQAAAYHIRGMGYQFSGRAELAIESYYSALKINESLKLDKESIRQLNNIGLIYRDEGEYEKALEYLEKFIKITKAEGFKQYEYYGDANVGYILMKQNKWDEALKRFEKALNSSEILNDSTALCTANYLIADVKSNQKDYVAAKHFAQKALNIANSTDFSLGKIFSQRVLSDVYRQEKKYDEARKIAEECMQYMAENAAYLYLEDVLNSWYNIEYETGNYKKALEIQHQLSARKDSLARVKTKEKIANSEYKHQLLQNEQENELLKIKNESSQKMSILATAVALLLLLVALLSLFAYRKSRNYNETLEEAIAERTKELEKSNKDLAKSNEELERFAYITSHDLKTPLLNIISFTELLEKQIELYDDEKAHKYLTFVKKGGKRLNNIITDTLEYSRLSYVEKESRIENINLNTTLTKVQNSISEYIEEKNAHIIIQDDVPSIKANAYSIFLLFQNLLENSIKYNESDTPTVKIYAKENQASTSIFLEDNGIGIEEKFHEKIFVMFSRLHNHSKYEGSGLGLSICKKIVEQLNGEIHLHSEIGKGSIFEIQLPADVIVRNETITSH